MKMVRFGIIGTGFMGGNHAAWLHAGNISGACLTAVCDIAPARLDWARLNIIKDTYRGYGFSAIETPCVEHIENLTSKQGGDNEKLIFKILKRGEKLNVEAAQTEADVVDGGLRYDLTLPLSRYYANNSANLSAPFKALHHSWNEWFLL